jgi:glycosyltransferase involved in cell wall biosynthesis
MRIAINAMFLIPNAVGGSETYLRGLVDALAGLDTGDEFLLVVGPESAPTFKLAVPGWRVRSSTIASRHRPARLLLEQTWLPMLAARSGCDLIHSAGYTSPLILPIPGVVSIHDMNYKRHPEDLSPLERLMYAMLIPSAARANRQVVTLTEASRADLLRWTHVAPGKVSAIPAAPRGYWPGHPQADPARLGSLGLEPPYVLSVSAAHPHKNLARLIEAFPVYDRQGASLPLVVVGLGGRAEREIERASQARDVRVLGWVSDEVLAALYRNAVALAFPSLYEGFGLPIIEAMAFGTPVLTSNFGAMAEVAGNAAELVDPHDVAAIRAGLERIVQDDARAAALRRLGRERASAFSWKSTAERMYAVYQRAARG